MERSRSRLEIPPAPVRTGAVRGARGETVKWGNLFVLVVSPVAAVAGVTASVAAGDVRPVDLALFAAMLGATGFAITAGYHRHYAHRSYDCHPLLAAFYLLFGAAALQNSALRWASNHRYHHRYVDGEGDPHSIRRGWFWAFAGWAMVRPRRERSLSNVADLARDPLVAWQHRHYLWLAILVGFGLPALAGVLAGRPGQALLWGGLVRLVALHHITFLFNLAGHTVGHQPHSSRDSSRDSWWLPFLTFGEGHHNFHHTFPRDYRCGVAWYHWDPTKWWIGTLGALGLARRLRRVAAVGRRDVTGGAENGDHHGRP